jgi:LacI family transcriptional regulator
VSALAGTPYRLVLAPADGPEYDAILALADGLVDGIVAVSPMVDTAWLEELAARVPVVMLGIHDDPENYDTVVGDDELGAREVMRHLLQLGHRRIAHVTEGHAVTAGNLRTPHSVRWRVYLDSMTEAGFGSLATVVRRGNGRDSIRQATAELLARSDPPTAIFAGHDDIALDVLAAIADSGRAYGEVSVAGYDNTDLAAHPLLSLTSVDQRGAEMGAEAVTMLLERIRGRTERRQHVVTPTLRVRGSTGPPPTASGRG